MNLQNARRKNKNKIKKKNKKRLTATRLSTFLWVLCLPKLSVNEKIRCKIIIQYKKSHSYRESFGMKWKWNFPGVNKCIKLESGNTSSLLRREHSNPTQSLAARAKFFNGWTSKVLLKVLMWVHCVLHYLQIVKCDRWNFSLRSYSLYFWRTTTIFSTCFSRSFCMIVVIMKHFKLRLLSRILTGKIEKVT